MKSKAIFLFFILNLFQHFSFSQNKIIDSLQIVLKTAKEDTAKVKALARLAYEFENSNPDTAIYFANAAIALATKLDYQMGIARAHFYKGSALINLAEFDNALKELNAALLIFDRLLHSASLGTKAIILDYKMRVYTEIGNAEYMMGNFSEAMTSFSTCLKISEESGDKSSVADAYNNLGIIYAEQGNYPEALKAQLNALKFREAGNDREKMAASYNNIGSIYDGMNNLTEALKNHIASLEIKKELNDKQGISQSYNNIGNIYASLRNFPEALKNNYASLAISKERGDKTGMASAYTSIALVNQKQGNLSEALENYFNALKISEEVGDKENLADVYTEIGKIYGMQKKNIDALLYLKKGLALSYEIGSPEHLYKTYSGLTSLDSAMGNYKDALNHYKLSITYRDSLFNEENTKKIVQSQMEYEFDKKEAKEKAIQEKKDALAASEVKRQRTIRNSTFAGLAFLLLFSIVVYYQRNKISWEKKRSDQLVVDKEMLIKEIHHRVKNNLQVISSLLELQSETIEDDKAKAAVMEGQSRVQSIALIHHKLYRADEMASVEFKSFVTDLYTQVESVFKKPNTEVEFKIIADETNISIDAAVPLGLIINELLTNTFKYAMGQNRKNIISIALGEGERESEGVSKNFKLVYRDNGPGLPVGYDLENSISFGMKVIRLLTEQLGGNLIFYNDNGSVFEIPFHS
ncbi:MAG: tetratricopeptide repeat protein [Bacteroidia bacterium]